MLRFKSDLSDVMMTLNVSWWFDDGFTGNAYLAADLWIMVSDAWIMI